MNDRGDPDPFQIFRFKYPADHSECFLVDREHVKHSLLGTGCENIAVQRIDFHSVLLESFLIN